MPSELLLLAQPGPDTVAGFPVWAVAGPALIVVVLLSLVFLFVARYKRCPSNKVLVISGRVGGGIVVWDGGTPGGGTSGFLQNMANTLPPMMNVLRDIAGVELPGYFGTLTADPKAGDVGGEASGVRGSEVAPTTAVAALPPAQSDDKRPERVRT